MFGLMFTNEQIRLIKIAILERDKKLNDIKRDNPMDAELCRAISENMKLHNMILSELEK